MQPLPNLAARSDNPGRLASVSRRYGMLYGAFAGLAFAVAAWGVDGYYLSQAHALYPWLKFIVGFIVCVFAGALAGWLSARLEKVYLAVLIWLAASALFAWLSIAIPFQIAPVLLEWLRPDLKGLLDYVFYPDFQVRFAVGLTWALILGLFVGLLQIMMTESAVFSASIISKLIPMLVCAVLMFVSGNRIDGLSNQPLRTALVTMDTVIQYAGEHQGQKVDPQVARQMRLSVTDSIEGLLHLPRRLVVSKYDNYLGEVDIVVEFGNTPVKCVTVYGQPVFCEKAIPSVPQ